jgi:hypothetical protein
MMMLFHFALFLAFEQATPQPPAECNYNRPEMFALDQNAFDQDMTGGWRKIAKDGCELAAADLIKDYRTSKEINSSTLFWHEGQLRAFANQTDAAAVLLNSARKPEHEDNGWGWNLYVDGTIAFLNSDKPALLVARDKLSKLPEPESAKTMKDIHGQPVKINWPMNLSVLDGLIRCWGRSYKEAYACPRPS